MPQDRQERIAMEREVSPDGLTYKDSDKVVEPSANIVEPFTEKQANIINGGENSYDPKFY